MEWLDGCDLVAYMGNIQRWCLPEAEALDYIDRAAEALEHVHAQGLLHRDIKPDNIMRCNDGRIKLIDFGLAKQFDPNLTYQNTGCLTEGYAPIEQYERRGKFTNALDIYALAATLYYLLTGKNPLSAEMRSGGVYKLEPPQTWNPNVSEAVNRAVMLGMEFEPVDRPQEVAEFRRSLLSAQPKMETFSFNIAQLQIKKSPSGKTEAVIVKKSPGQAKRFIENLGNGVEMEMVEIPSGELITGTLENRITRMRPQTPFKITSFYMGRYPVTQLQYEAIMGENPSYFKGANLPVDSVKWENAYVFCQRLVKHSQRKYCLPTIAQWIYACRAGTTTPFYFGETISTDVANYNGNYVYGDGDGDGDGDGVKGKLLGKTTPVGLFDAANRFGLDDMHENVLEWCENGLFGGSWNLPPGLCSLNGFDDSLDYIIESETTGFRVVCSLPNIL